MGHEGMAVVVFPNSQMAVRAEELCKGEGIEAKLIPTPRHLSSACGLALRFPAAERERVRHLLEGAQIPHSEISEM